MPASALLSLALSSTALGRQFDNYAYDFLFRLIQPAPWTPASIILAIDEQTLTDYHGNAGIRTALADGISKIQAARPAAVAVDVILAEPSTPEIDARLERAFASTHNLVLASYLLDHDKWNDPIPRFRQYAFAVGHVQASFDDLDSVSREVPLMKVAGHDRRWSLALDAFRAVRGAQIVESPQDLQIGSLIIPSKLRDFTIDGRTLRVRYPPLAMGRLPSISIAELNRNPSLASRFAGKVVFVGETALAAGDSWSTPYSNGKTTPGIEMHASEYETLAQRNFLVDAPFLAVVGFCFLLAAGAGIIFTLGSGWIANLEAALLILASQAAPAIAFENSTVFAWMPGTLSAILSVAAAATWRHLIVRRELARSEDEKTRYQKAMQFVTHEMRTPLTAIQGSSELISRYGQMPEAKRKQMAELINAESKRLARMIETFLSVERLSAGQMEMKQERFPLPALVERCTERARPYAERKQIEIDIEHLPADELTGDRELMEYAVYNLLTNAVKYSPALTRVRVFSEDDKGGRVRLSIQDQGIGMDKKEVSRIFEKFYRTKRAEQSGETGTGIGLSIVEQIVTQHGGTIQVESEPGKGSRFTLILKRAS
ncbi:MAG: CHASE2 domain-containing protein [Acidobacteriota bacterium]